MGIKYSLEEHAIYLNDYGNDRIEKITFENNDFKLRNIETIFKSELSNNGGQMPLLNPIMSVVYDKSLLFWIDYEDGLKTTVFKSSCLRTIYKIKEPLSLKFIQISTFISTNAEFEDSVKAKSSKQDNTILSKLISLNGNGGKSSILKYPPDFYSNYQYSSNDFNTHSFQQAAASHLNILVAQNKAGYFFSRIYLFVLLLSGISLTFFVYM